MFKIKKNGIVYVFGRIASLLASAIGFTPPTGMSATNVQGAIEEVNTRVNANAMGIPIDLNNYTSNINYYVAPNDGYVFITASANNTCAVSVSDGNQVVAVATQNGLNTSLFVKKGLRIYRSYNSGTNSVYFIPLS